MSLFSSTGSLPGSAVRVPTTAAPYIQWLARCGYAARGVVYVVVGALALRAAFATGAPEDSSGALQVIVRQPFGRILLGVVAVGLAGWVVWRLFQAIANPERLGGARGVARRVGYLVSGLLHAGLAVEAVRLVLGSGGRGQGSEARTDHWTAMLLSQPAGRWLVAAVGGAILLFGLYELVRSFGAKVRRELDLTGLEAGTQRRIVLMGRLGTGARGVVFGIIGWFLLRAALEYDPQEARGFQSALQALERSAYGPWLLAAVGLGLLCYGLFELAESRYRVIRTG